VETCGKAFGRKHHLAMQALIVSGTFRRKNVYLFHTRLRKPKIFQSKNESEQMSLDFHGFGYHS